MQTIYAHKELPKRFMDKVVVNSETGCWEWTARTDKNGYGQFRYSGKTYRSHRLAFDLTVGIPEGLHLDHLCNNPGCVNPQHLEPVSHRANVLRGEAPSAENAKKTHCKHGHELTPDNLVVKQHQPKARYCKLCDNRRSAEYYAKNKVRKKSIKKDTAIMTIE